MARSRTAQPGPVAVLTLDLDDSPAVALDGGLRGSTHEEAWIIVTRAGRPLGIVTVAMGRAGPSVLDLVDQVQERFSEIHPDEPPSHERADLPVISVVVPTHNRRPELLAKCLGSLTSLDYPNFEIIVVENGPRSGAGPVPAKAGTSLGVRRLRVDQANASAARNCGLEAAIGDIVAFTDDDIEAPSGWLHAIARRFMSDPSIDAVTGIIVPRELETPAQIWFERYYGGFNRSFTATRYGPGCGAEAESWYPYAPGRFGTGGNMAFRRQVLLDLGGFDVRLGPGTPTQGGEDSAVLVGLLLQDRTLVVDPASMIYHNHPRTDADLKRQVRSYGVGLAAFLTSLALSDPRYAFGLLRGAPRGVRMLSTSSRHPVPSLSGSTNGTVFPRRLRLEQARGLLAGPFRYLYSATRRRRGLDPMPQLRQAASARRPVNHLTRSALALIVSASGSGLLGLVFWFAAAHLYTAKSVGLGSAEISSMMVLSALSQVNLVTVFPRFCQQAGIRTRRFLTTGYAVSSVLSVLVATAFVLGHLGRHFLPAGPLAASIFIVSVPFWTLFTIQDAALTGLRAAIWVPVENISFGIAKIVLLVLFAGVLSQTGVFVGWTLPVVAAVVAVNLYIYTRVLPAHMLAANGRSAMPSRGDLSTFVAGEYLGSLALVFLQAVPPIVVVQALGAAQTAYFSVPWMFGAAVYAVLVGISNPLLVEASAEPEHLYRNVRRAVRLGCGISLPAAALMILGAPIFLPLLGAAYARHGAAVLEYVGAAVPFIAVNLLYVTLARIRRRIRRSVLTQLAVTAIVLALTVTLVDKHGIAAAGFALFAAEAVVAVVVMPSVIRQYRHLRREGALAGLAPESAALINVSRLEREG
jgi:glycosyltransferase involved in cell wall biosynthesis/O-antigen/teichoic acid export membrane protein